MVLLAAALLATGLAGQGYGADSAPASGPAGSPVLQLTRARDLFLKGQYQQARDSYGALLKDPRTAQAAAAGLADIDLQAGQYAEGLARIDGLGAAVAKSDALLVAGAELLLAVGRTKEALADVERAASLNPRNTTARRLAGQLHEARGEYDQAIAAYAWFEDLLTRGYPSSAAALTDAGIGISRLAVLRPGPESAERTRYALQELLQPAVERADPRWWPARLASADLLLSKYNLPDAAGDYQAALKLNPTLAEAHVGLGAAALAEWRFEEVEKHVREALRINPASAAAHCLDARLHLTERRFPDAAAAAQRALQTNPTDIQALGLLAAALTRSGKADEAKAALDKAAAAAPRSPVAAHEMGVWLAAGRQFADAEAAFKRAIDLAPWWPAPRTSLGMMYMEMGAEPEARKVLDASWNLDHYNAETKNTLDLLDRLERFGRDETAHFVVESDDKTDAPVRQYLAAYMETIYEEVARQYGGAPADKTIIEVFPTHQAFAVRITGNPWLHTVGACTGRVIAVDAPRVSASGHPYNWARVLRHEFTHTITLAATRNRIPHWFTEGLAVWSESAGGPPRGWDWCRLLSNALRTGRLFELDALDWGFARPHRPDDRTLAYAQSEWIVEYLIASRGQKVIGEMLTALARGDGQAEMFRKCTGQPPNEFLASFRGWAAEQVRGWGLPTAPLASAAELQQQLSKAADGEKPALLTSLAERQLLDGKVSDAEKTIRQAATDTASAETMRVFLLVTTTQIAQARSESKSKQLLAEAADWARRLEKLQPDSIEAAEVLAMAALRASDQPTAITHLERLKRICPLNPLSYDALVKIYLARGDEAKALPELIALAGLHDDDVDLPIKIAELLAKTHRESEAIPWLQRAVRIDPYSIEVHTNLGQVLMRTESFDQAAAEFDVLTRLQPGSAEHLSSLAFALQRAGKGDQAIAAARKAVALDPNSPAKGLLK